MIPLLILAAVLLGVTFLLLAPVRLQVDFQKEFPPKCGTCSCVFRWFLRERREKPRQCRGRQLKRSPLLRGPAWAASCRQFLLINALARSLLLLQGEKTAGAPA